MLREEFPTLSNDVLDRLARAEHSWRKVVSINSFDFGAVIVSFAKAAEQALRLDLGINDERAGLGALARGIQNSSRWPIAERVNLTQEIRELSELRGKGAHPDIRSKPTREDVKISRDTARKSREMARNIISTLLADSPNRTRLMARPPKGKPKRS